MKEIKKLQIGKNKLTAEFIEQTRNIFKNEKAIKVALLKSSTRNREEAKEIGDKLIDALGENYIYRLIGYTLVVKKLRKARIKKSKKF